MAAGAMGGGRHYDDGSTNAVGLPVVNGVDYFGGAKGHWNITIHPNGDDEWNFNVTIHMNFAGRGWP